MPNFACLVDKFKYTIVSHIATVLAAYKHPTASSVVASIFAGQENDQDSNQDNITSLNFGQFSRLNYVAITEN